MLLQDEQYIIKWLSQYGALSKIQVRGLLQKSEDVTRKIIKGLRNQNRVFHISDGYYVGLDPISKPDPRLSIAIWVLLKFVDKVDPMNHHPATYPSQIFFLKEDVGYEIIVIYDGEEDRMRLLQTEEDKKFIIVVSNPSRISKLRIPDAPCLFATVDFEGEEIPEVHFFTEEALEDG